MKPILIFIFIVAIVVSNFKCTVAKFSTRLNDIDSVIRIVVPDHNCGCDYKGKAVDLIRTKGGKLNTYFWQSVYTNDTGVARKIDKAKKIKFELIRLIPELENYRRLYIEFRQNITSKTDTVFKYNLLGTAFLLKDECNGYMPNITAKHLIKKSHHKRVETALCNQ